MDRDGKLALLARLVREPAKRKAIEKVVDRLVPVLWLVPAMGAAEHVLGGLPALPVGTPWPLHEGRALPYLLGIDLGTLPPWAGFPDDGILHLFGSFSRVHAMIVPPGAELAETAPPALPWLDDDLQEGEGYGRMALKAVPGLWFAELGEDEPAAIDRVCDRLQAEDAIVRIGGAGPSWGGALADAQERCYLHAQGRGRLCWHTEDDPADVERLIVAAQAVKRSPPFAPAPAPPAIAKRLEDAAGVLLAGIEALGSRLAQRELHGLRRLADGIARTRAKLAAGGKERESFLYQELAMGVDLLNGQLQALSGKAAAAVRAVFAAPTLEALAGAPQVEGPQRKRAQDATRDLALQLERAVDDPAALMRLIAAAQRDEAAAITAPLSAHAGEALVQLRERLLAADQSHEPRRMLAAWQQLEDHLQAHAPELPLGELAFSLRERNRIAHNLNANQRLREGESPEELIALRDDLRWWRDGLKRHRQESAAWRPLLAIFSSGGFCWSDSGVLMIYGIPGDVARGEVGHLQGMVEST